MTLTFSKWQQRNHRLRNLRRLKEIAKEELLRTGVKRDMRRFPPTMVGNADYDVHVFLMSGIGT